jgi:GT2 family glycosyltransferase
MKLSAVKLTLSIIIVSYNTRDFTLESIKAVLTDLKNFSTLKKQTEIIVVDNHSSDKSVSALKLLAKTEPLLKIITNKENLGFAKANNIGIKQSQGEFIFLLNSDTHIQVGALKQLVSTFQQRPLNDTTAYLSSTANKLDKLGILAATLLNRDKTFQAQGGSYPTLLSLTAQMFFLDNLPILKKLLPTTQQTGRASLAYSLDSKKLIQQDWVGGAAMIIRRSLLEEINLLDENIFMYGEDIELCMRAKHHHWDIAVDPQAQVVHYGSASSNSDNAILSEFKAYLYIWAKHKPHWQSFPLKTLLWFGAILRIFLFGTILKDKHQAQVYKQALGLIK